jgi:hypothetical protein
MKGLSAATKRFKLGTQKFYRMFVDEIVLFTRNMAPLIEVKSWKGIMQNVKNSIASDVLVCCTFNIT